MIRRICKRLQSTQVDYESISFHKNIEPNSTYHPRDLNERFKPKKKEILKTDVINLLEIDLKKEYKNTKLLSYFVTQMGQIKPREKTNLTPENQRKIAKLIKRARAFGLLPFSYKPQ